MLAQSAEAAFNSKDHLFEVKWDGTRCVAFIEKDRLRLQNRRFLEMKHRYPELAALKRLPAGTVLDGEIVVLEDGKPSFNRLQKREHLLDERKISILSKELPATFIVFDLLYLSGKSTMDERLDFRRRTLKEIVGKLANPHVIASEFITEHGSNYFAAVEGLGLEGIMAKRLDSPYVEGKRSKNWLKIKVAQEANYEIIGFTKQDTTDFISALLIGERRGRSLYYKGKVGSGFTERQRKLYFEELSRLDVLARPPKDGPREAVWRHTGLKCRVRFFEKTKTGKLRAPVFQGLIK